VLVAEAGESEAGFEQRCLRMCETAGDACDGLVMMTRENGWHSTSPRMERTSCYIQSAADVRGERQEFFEPVVRYTGASSKVFIRRRPLASSAVGREAIGSFDHSLNYVSTLARAPATFSNFTTGGGIARDAFDVAVAVEDITATISTHPTPASTPPPPSPAQQTSPAEKSWAMGGAALLGVLAGCLLTLTAQCFFVRSALNIGAGRVAVATRAASQPTHHATKVIMPGVPSPTDSTKALKIREVVIQKVEKSIVDGKPQLSPSPHRVSPSAAPPEGV